MGFFGRFRRRRRRGRRRRAGFFSRFRKGNRVGNFLLSLGEALDSGNIAARFQGIDFEALESRRDAKQRQADLLSDRQAKQLFERIVEDMAEHLRANVPVRTGLMKRRTDARGDNRGDRRQVDIYSDAMNNQGREYAQYVARYDRALTSTVSRAWQRINRAVIRLHIYTIRPGGIIQRRTVFVDGSRFMDAKKEGTRLVLSFRSPLLLEDAIV